MQLGLDRGDTTLGDRDLGEVGMVGRVAELDAIEARADDLVVLGQVGHASDQAIVEQHARVGHVALHVQGGGALGFHSGATERKGSDGDNDDGNKGGRKG